ncbi:MAG: hypothetical protein IJA90_04080 [Peptococcaceae bacterium]|nr:hypothetical protein [Peptococcaceae bacterium]
MDEQVLRYREAKLMEPIYRMFKVIEQEDVLKAQTLMSVTMQYIIEHYSGKNLTPADVQQILRAVLLKEEDGRYYAMYVYNEIQVKAAGWLTILAVDCPVTLEALGAMADKLAEELQKKDFITLTAAEVMNLLEQIVMPVDAVVLERLQLNRERYLAELRTFLVQ